MIWDNRRDSLEEDRGVASYHLNQEVVTFFDLLFEEAPGLGILAYGSGSHVENLIISFVHFVEEKTNSFVNIVGLQLTHDVWLGDSTVDVTHNDLLILIP